MGFNGVGGGNMNITIQMGNPQGNTSGANNGGFEGLQIRFNDSKDKLDNDKGDQGALQDLRNLKKDVDSALQKETAKENSGEAKMQDMMEQLLEMIMELLQEVMGGEGDGEGEGKDKGGCKGGSKSHGQDQGQGSGLQVQITF